MNKFVRRFLNNLGNNDALFDNRIGKVVITRDDAEDILTNLPKTCTIIVAFPEKMKVFDTGSKTVITITPYKDTENG